MEGADGHAAHRPLSAQTGLQPLAHLCRGLVGEGDGGDLAGADALFLHQPRDAGNQRLGLAGARSGDDRRHGGLGGDRRPLLRVQRLPGGGGRGILLRGSGFFQLPFGGGFLGGRLGAEQGDLSAEPLDLRRGQQGDDAVLAVKAGTALHLSCPEPPDTLRHAGACDPLNIFRRYLPEDGKLRPQLPQHGLIQGLGLFARGGAAGGSGDDLRQRGQVLKGLGALRPEARRTVRQFLHPMLHADGQLLSAHGAQAVPLRRLHRRQADAALPVAVQMVLALLREELHGAQKALSGADGLYQFRIGAARVQQVRLPAQLGGGVGVGVGHQRQPVQGGDPPVHGRV